MSTILTLVGAKQAKIGLSFLHCGEVENCRECKLLKVCQKLEPGRVYEVVKSRGIAHECVVHQDGVVLVEVREGSVLAAIDQRSCIPGASIIFAPRECGHLDCEWIKDCIPVGLSKGDKCRVEEVVQKVRKCAAGERIALCRVRRASTTSA